MPSGTPSPQEILEQAVTGFALDTCILRQAGYRFDTGALSLLSQQLPPWMKIYMPDVVSREVVRQQVQALSGHLDGARSALRSVQKMGIDVDALIGSVDEMMSSADRDAQFRARIREFVRELRGKEILVDGSIVKEMFDRYFAGAAPFGTSKERKSEFPDAAALLALERVARRDRTKIVAVSNDNAWTEFAAKSESIYCVRTLDSLTSLFVATSSTASSIRARFTEMLGQIENPVISAVRQALDEKINDLGWDFDGYSGEAARVDPVLDFIEVLNFQADGKALRLWMSPDDEEQCVIEVELDVEAKFHVSTEFYVFDSISIDREEFSIGTGSAVAKQTVTITALLKVSGELLKGDPSDWEIDVEFQEVRETVDVGEVHYDRGGDYEE